MRMYKPDKQTIMRKRMMDSIDKIVDQYVSDRYFNELLRTEWPWEGIEIVKHIPEFVPKSAFTPEQISFMETDPAWKVIFPDGDIPLRKDPYL